jgi:uncharacterized protein
VKDDQLIVEVTDDDRSFITALLLRELGELAAKFEPSIQMAHLDAQSYKPGRAFVGAK